jgi:hypothetical protein
MPSDLETEALR